MTLEQIIEKLTVKMKWENETASDFLETAVDEENDTAFMYHSGKADGIKYALDMLAWLRKEGE